MTQVTINQISTKSEAWIIPTAVNAVRILFV